MTPEALRTALEIAVKALTKIRDAEPDNWADDGEIAANALRDIRAIVPEGI